MKKLEDSQNEDINQLEEVDTLSDESLDPEKETSVDSFEFEKNEDLGLRSYIQQLITKQNQAEQERPNFKKEEIQLLAQLVTLRETDHEKYLSFRSDLERYYYKQVIALSRRYHSREGVNTPEDYISQWLLGLYIGFSKYSSEYETTFLTFWQRYIQNELDKLTTKSLNIARGDYFKIVKLRKELLKIHYDINLIDSSIVYDLIQSIFKLKTKEWVRKTYREISGYLQSFNWLSLDHTSEGEEWESSGDESNLLNWFAVNSVDEYMESQLKKEMVSEILQQLANESKYDERISDMLKMRFNYLTEDDKVRLSKKMKKEFPKLEENKKWYTLSEIWKFFDLTRERVRQLEEKFLDKIKKSSIYSQLELK